MGVGVVFKSPIHVILSSSSTRTCPGPFLSLVQALLILSLL